jgi:ABC-2 type transport system ATP-binding protein
VFALVGELLASLGVPLRARTLVRDLSGGARQKLSLAVALLGQPRLLLLDEPYQGFDHGSYLDFWRHAEAWCYQGRAVVVVTHLLTELHRADQVLELPKPAECGQQA